MLDLSRQLYPQFRQSIRACASDGLDVAVQAECATILATRYWAQLRAALEHYQFVSIEDEVQFFKIEKPKFFVEYEYYQLVAYSLQFLPARKLHQRSFWKQQAERLCRFKVKYALFHQYFSSGETHLDVVYFTRGNPDSCGYKWDETESGFDILIAKLAARERYEEYAHAQLALLNAE